MKRKPFPMTLSNACLSLAWSVEKQKLPEPKPLKIGLLHPKKKPDRLPSTNFQGHVSFRGGYHASFENQPRLNATKRRLLRIHGSEPRWDDGFLLLQVFHGMDPVFHGGCGRPPGVFRLLVWFMKKIPGKSCLNHQFFSKNGGFPNLDDDPKPLVKICKNYGETQKQSYKNWRKPRTSKDIEKSCLNTGVYRWKAWRLWVWV